MTSVRFRDGRALLLFAVALGLLLRVGILAHTVGLGTPIVDEQHYSQIASNILNGHGFAWGPGRPTSIRPPLYPSLVAAVWAIAGEGNLQAVRLVQVGLSAATAWLVFLIGRRAFTPVAGRVAAGVVWLYPSFIFFDVTILTETLYTFLLVSFVLLTVKVIETPRWWIATAV